MNLGKLLQAAFLTFILSTVASEVLAQKKFNILDFGAKPGLRMNNAPAIQATIDAAAKVHGIVIIPDGIFVSGPLILKSDVNLNLTDNAVLLGSSRYMDYKDVRALLTAEGQKNISITGGGIIDGQGQDLVRDLLHQLRAGVVSDAQWLIKRPTEEKRPFILLFQGCENVKISGISIKNGASWIQNFKGCKDVFVDKIKVTSTTYWNNDGIDIVDCENVRVLNSYFDVADDAICLKSESVNGVCKNVLVENCTTRSSASGFKIGTGSMGRFDNIEVKNLKVFDTFRSAVAIETVDGASLENVKISSVRAYNTGNAIFIRLGHRNKDTRYSSLKNVLIEDLIAEIPSGKPDIGYPFEGSAPKNYPVHNLLPASITGIPGHPVQNVTLRNISISYGGGIRKAKGHISLDSLSGINENIAGYPEFSMFGDLPSWGLYLRHAESISLENVKLSYLQTDYRPAIIADDIRGLRLRDVVIPESEERSAIVLNNVTKPEWSGLKLPAKESESLLIQSK